MEAVREGAAALAMIACENSLAGRVGDVHHLLPESGLFVVGEHFQRVEHCLLAPRGARIEGLKRAHSHEVALGQVRRVLKELHLKPVVQADTAGSAELVAQWNNPEDCAIASSLAAELFGLDILRRNVEDAAHNTTRFYVMAREPPTLPADAPGLMTTFVFRVRNVPAALYKALGRVRHQRREHDQAGKLHGRRPVHRHPVPVRRRGPSGAAGAAPGAGGAFVLLARDAILGVYPASPFRREQDIGGLSGLCLIRFRSTRPRIASPRAAACVAPAEIRQLRATRRRRAIKARSCVSSGSGRRSPAWCGQ